MFVLRRTNVFLASLQLRKHVCEVGRTISCSGNISLKGLYFRRNFKFFHAIFQKYFHKAMKTWENVSTFLQDDCKRTTAQIQQGFYQIHQYLNISRSLNDQENFCLSKNTCKGSESDRMFSKCHFISPMPYLTIIKTATKNPDKSDPY